MTEKASESRTAYTPLYADASVVSRESNTPLPLDPEEATNRPSLSYDQQFDNDETAFLHQDHQDLRNVPTTHRRTTGATKIAFALKAIAFVLALALAFLLGRFLDPRTLYSGNDVPLIQNQKTTSLSGPRNGFFFSNGTRFQKPSSLKFVGIVFYGRRQFVNILDCYLRKNLVVNGGMLDEVHFLMHTDVDKDRTWLRKLVRRSGLKDYKIKREDLAPDWNMWSYLYREYISDPDTIYIKIDDDITFIDDYAIPELIRTTLEHSEAHSVVSNNINNRWSFWYHNRINAVTPYLPDEDPNTNWPLESWRPSQLPRHPHIRTRNQKRFTELAIPHKGHRWLPVTYDQNLRTESLRQTPWGAPDALPNPESPRRGAITGWDVTAQVHYSLFENLEKNQLHRYYFGSGQDHIWNLWYGRYNINLMAIRGSHVTMHPIVNETYGDEKMLTEIIPRELEMPVLVATRAIASHFAFHDEREHVLMTDLLDRYIAYANEMVCEAGNQKTRFGPKFGPHHLRPDIDEGESSDYDDEVIADGPADLFNNETDDLDAQVSTLEP